MKYSKNVQSTPHILNLSTEVITNQRTVIWLQNQDSAVNWSKWDAVVTSISSYNKWYALNTNIRGIVLTDTTNISEDDFESLKTISKKVHLLLASNAFLDLKPPTFWKDNFDNIIVLESVIDTYPFIQYEWDGTDTDAVTIFTMLCRYNRIVDCTPSEKRQSMLPSCVTVAQGIVPNQIWLVTQFFKHSDNGRFQEIKECLKQNCKCPYIDKIVLLNEKDYSNEYKNLYGSNKIQQIIIGKRLTYSDFLEYTHKYIPNNVYCILSNADIFFGEALTQLWNINMEDKVLALLRWDVDTFGVAKLCMAQQNSQDAWIFLSDSIKARTFNYKLFDFALGLPGCDNAFLTQILKNKFLISNPSFSIKAFHLHNTNIRNYTKKDAIHFDIYIHIEPTYVINSKQESAPSKPYTTLSCNSNSFQIKSISDTDAITYCKMLDREGRYKWNHNAENSQSVSSMPVYKWNKMSVTPNGLVYGYQTIYNGKYASDKKYNYWENANTNILNIHQKTNTMCAIPFKDLNIFKHPDTYILHYLSRCARILKTNPGASFWVPPEFSEYIKLFKWEYNSLNALPFYPYTACYADEVVGLLPSPEVSELCNEDIITLRNLYPNWMNEPIGNICSVVIDSYITQDFAENRIKNILDTAFEGTKWTLKIVKDSSNNSEREAYKDLIGASLCIFIGGENTSTQWSKLWTLPTKCCVIEFQQELKINGEFQHLAHVAELKSWILLLAKGKHCDVQEQIIEQLLKWINKNKDEII